MLNLGKYPFARPLSEWIDDLFASGPVRRVLFRVDAGRVRRLSFGHIARCTELARVLREQCAAETLFLMKDYKEGVAFALHHDHKVHTLPTSMKEQDECTAILDVITDYRPDWLVLDLPERDFSSAFYGSIKARGTRILFIDDARFRVPDVDAFLNSSILALDNTVLPAGKNIRCFLGPEYFICTPLEKAEKSFSASGPFTVVISFGGSDPSDLSLKVMQCLAGKDLNTISFTLILGPGYDTPDVIEAAVKNSRQDVTIIYSPADIHACFRTADLVICAGGLTLYETVAMGLPVMAIASIEHEQAVVDAFKRQNLLADGLLEWNGDKFYEKFISAVARLSHKKQI